jgi:hypothetical protein
MLNKIFKYTLNITDTQMLDLPFKSKILSVMEQNNNIVLYAVVNEHQGIMDKYTIAVIGTGNPISIDIDKYTFLNTVKLHNGTLMFHIFYKRENNI